MLLAELRGRRPKKARKATLEYDPKASQPFRKEDVIVLPDRGDLQLYRLQTGWNQFIARFDFSTVWFGGTDENPFLVRIDDGPFDGFCRRGPEGFYSSLLPRLPSKTYRRQGDIFASPIPFTWEEIRKMYHYIHGWDVEILESDSKGDNSRLFGTRHRLNGTQMGTTVMLPEEYSGSFGPRQAYFVLAEGTVVAPDHTDMKLEGIHALTQTLHLHDPRTAD